MTVSINGGQVVGSGSFDYTNASTKEQQIVTLIVGASNPSLLASLTVSVNGTSQSVTLSPVGTSNSFNFNPPVAVNAGATVTFSFTAQAANGNAVLSQGVHYAAILDLGWEGHDGGWPMAPLGGLLIVTLLLLPLRISKPQRVTAMIVALALTLIISGCGGGAGGGGGTNASSSGGLTPVSQPVYGSGSLARPVLLSNLALNNAVGASTTTQQVTGMIFK